MPVESYDRHRRDQERVRLSDQVAHRYPLMWPVVWVCRAAKWAVHRTVYGILGTRPGRVMLFLLTVWGLANAALGTTHGTLQGWLPFFLLAALCYGAWEYSFRRQWEDKVRNVVYHDVPGHTGRETEVVWFLTRFNLARWTGGWQFGFRIPAGMREVDEAEVSQHLRSRLPAAPGASWSFSWDWRRGLCLASIAADLPDVATRELEEAAPDAGKVPLGMGMDGEVYWPLDANFGNILVTGGPGGGKSVIVNGIVRHIAEHRSVIEGHCIDMKGGVELGHLEKYPFIRGVAEDLESSVELLRHIREEVDKRQAALRAEDVKKIGKLNERRTARGEAPLKRLVLLVDELAELTDVPETPGKSPEEKEEHKKRAESKALLDSIVRLGRAGGVHVVAALQRPDVRYMTGAMRSNIQARVATGRLDQSGCQMVESKLAAELPAVPGRGVLWLGGQEEIVQYYLTEDEDLDAVANGHSG